MKETDLWAEYEELLEAEDFEAAGRLLDRIPPVSDAEWRRRLDEAPLDDEPVSESLLRRFEEFERVRSRFKSRSVG
jgi:hypothetical protein